MGCCGRNYTNDEEVFDSIWKNTKEFEEIRNKLTFRDRSPRYSWRKSGVCRNLIFTDKSMKKVMCPLHPGHNYRKDLRKGHCEIDHLCDAARQFPNWDMKKQNAFISFIKKKKLDWYEYSMGMDSGKLLKEFLK